jgi:hypothetical protein
MKVPIMISEKFLLKAYEKNFAKRKNKDEKLMKKMRLWQAIAYPDEESHVHHKSRYVTKNQAQNSPDHTRGSKI